MALKYRLRCLFLSSTNSYRVYILILATKSTSVALAKRYDGNCYRLLDGMLIKLFINYISSVTQYSNYI